MSYVVFTPQALVELLKGNGGYVSDLPRDARFVGAYYDDIQRQFRVHLESETFDLIPEGQAVPHHTVTFGRAS